MYSKKVLEQVHRAFNAIKYTQDSRRRDDMISHMLDKRFYESRYTVAEKRCLLIRAYVKAYDRQRGGEELRVYYTDGLFSIKATLLGRVDATRPETVKVNEAMSIARLAIAAMDTEDRA